MAASQIHKAGQLGAQAAKYLFYNMAFGRRFFWRARSTFSPPTKTGFFRVGQLGKSSLRLGALGLTQYAEHWRRSTCSPRPTVSPAYIGVGYVIGPELAALNFSGSVLAWGLLIPLLIYFLGPQLQTFLPANAADEFVVRSGQRASGAIIVRPIAVGSMLVGTGYTLFRMRKNLIGGPGAGISRIESGAPPTGIHGAHGALYELDACSRWIGVRFCVMSCCTVSVGHGRRRHRGGAS